MVQVEHATLAGEGSWIVWNGTRVEGVKVDIEALYNTEAE